MDELRELLTNETAASVARALAALLVGLVLGRLLGRVVGGVVEKRADRQAGLLVRRGIFYGIFVLAVLAAIRELGLDMSVFLGAAGILTVAIGFASQTSASNVISGLFLIGERPFVLGDIIEVSGKTGEVLSIDLLSVKIRTFDNLFVRIPNELLVKSPITNYSRFPIRRVEMDLHLSRDVDLDEVREVLMAVADDNPAGLIEPAAVVNVTSFTDAALVVRFGVWVSRARTSWAPRAPSRPTCSGRWRRTSSRRPSRSARSPARPTPRRSASRWCRRAPSRARPEARHGPLVPGRQGSLQRPRGGLRIGLGDRRRRARGDLGVLVRVSVERLGDEGGLVDQALGDGEHGGDGDLIRRLDDTPRQLLVQVHPLIEGRGLPQRDEDLGQLRSGGAEGLVGPPHEVGRDHPPQLQEVREHLGRALGLVRQDLEPQGQQGGIEAPRRIVDGDPAAAPRRHEAHRFEAIDDALDRRGRRRQLPGEGADRGQAAAGGALSPEDRQRQRSLDARGLRGGGLAGASGGVGLGGFAGAGQRHEKVYNTTMLYNLAQRERRFQRMIDRRVACFREVGLLAARPTWWQLRQAEIEMTPWVVSTDVTAEEAYEGAPLGHPWVRQPLILAHVGPDHLRTGSGLGARLPSICRHLELTYHRGMPVFDLQVVQTHPGGLDALRASLEELRANDSPRARRQNLVADRILADREAYYARFLGSEGWIARAAAFDYPAPEAEGSECPEEFWSLVGLLTYAETFDAERPPLPRLPAHLARLFTRRFREGRGMGWFDAPTPNEARS